MSFQLIIGGNKPETKVSLEEELMTVYVQDYDDNYHRTEDQPSTELERKVRNIKRKYKNVMSYNDAMIVYNEYMDLLKDKYGDGKKFKIYKKMGLIEERIPPKPKLRLSKFNKFVLDNGIVLSNTKITYKDIAHNNEWYNQSIDEGLEGINIECNDIITEYEGEEFEKMIDKMMDKRIRYSSKLRSSDLDYIEEYLGVKNINNSKRNKDTKGYTITELFLMQDGDEFDNDDNFDNVGIVEYAGRYFTKDTIETINFYKGLDEFGWDPYLLMRRRSGSKGITKLFKEEKKKKKKKKKQVDGFMLNILTDGNKSYIDSFEAYEKEMLNFTSNNLLR